MKRSARALCWLLLGVALGCREPDAPADAAPPGETLALSDGAQRLDLRFACGDAQCAGWLYLPPGDAPRPAVVLAGGFAGTRDVGLPHVAERLARAGLAAFVFDYRGFGASGGSPRQLVDP